eukprot:gene25423-11083_t
MDQNGKIDIGAKICIGLGASIVGGWAIVVPNKKQKDIAALELYDKPFAGINDTQQRSAEFKAGHDRWCNFFETKWYPLTRKLPGAKSPFLNPYKDQAAFKEQGEQNDF